jgi:hypothetical protein
MVKAQVHASARSSISMSCKQVDEFLDGAPGLTPSLPESVAAHSFHCERCRRLIELMRAKMPEEALPPDVRSRIESLILGSLEAVRPLSPPSTFVLGLLAIFLLLAAGGIGMMGAGAVGVMSLWQFVATGLILGAGAVLLALSLSRQMIPGSYHRVRPAALIPCVAGGFLLAFLTLFPWRVNGDFFASGLRCAGAGLAMIVPASVCFWLIIRRGVVLSPRLAGAGIGLLAGLAGALVLHFGCEIAGAPHLLVWHAGVPVFSALAGFLLGGLAARGRAVIASEPPRKLKSL